MKNKSTEGKGIKEMLKILVNLPTHYIRAILSCRFMMALIGGVKLRLRLVFVDANRTVLLDSRECQTLLVSLTHSIYIEESLKSLGNPKHLKDLQKKLGVGRSKGYLDFKHDYKITKDSVGQYLYHLGSKNAKRMIRYFADYYNLKIT